MRIPTLCASQSPGKASIPVRAKQSAIASIHSAAVVAQCVTGVDRPAEDDGRGGGRELAVQRPCHPLVHQEEALVDLALTHQDVALEDEPQRLQIRDAETAAEVEGPPGRLERAVVVARGEGEHRAGPGEEPVLGALGFFGEQPLGALEPATGDREAPPCPEVHAQNDCRHRGPPRLALGQENPVRTLSSDV
jgi:hypothetical protein